MKKAKDIAVFSLEIYKKNEETYLGKVKKKKSTDSFQLKLESLQSLTYLTRNAAKP
jgi:hypothetical protein